MIKNKRTSIQDIAEAVGVSIATVSRVFNKTGNVREETVKRVLETADKMNYRPDRVARRMRVKNSDSLLIGLIISDLGNPFFSELSRGVEDVAYKHQHAVLICSTDENPGKEKFYIDSLLSERVSGMIIAPTNGNAGYLKKLVSNGYPVVNVDRHLSDLNVDTVTINNKQGAYLAVRRLIQLGHRRIGIINGIRGVSTTEERYAGYKQAVKEAGLPVSKELIVFENFKESGGRKAMHTLLSLKHPPTAVFSANNLMTLGCIEEMYDHGVNIPGDIALIGFDDMSWSEALNPPLTAVKQPGYELGMQAAELLIKRLASPGSNAMNVMLNPELVVRKSCGGAI